MRVEHTKKGQQGWEKNQLKGKVKVLGFRLALIKMWEKGMSENKK